MDIADRFDEALRANKVRHYRKRQNVPIRPAVPGEVIETVIEGQRETVNTAKAGDYVVRGAKGENYIITAQILADRYGPPISGPRADGYYEYPAKGNCYAFRYEGEPFKFVAPWGEDMLVNPGDYVATGEVGSNLFYRIEQHAFAETYVEAPS